MGNLELGSLGQRHTDHKLLESVWAKRHVLYVGLVLATTYAQGLLGNWGIWPQACVTWLLFHFCCWFFPAAGFFLAPSFSLLPFPAGLFFTGLPAFSLHTALVTGGGDPSKELLGAAEASEASEASPSEPSSASDAEEVANIAGKPSDAIVTSDTSFFSFLLPGDPPTFLPVFLYRPVSTWNCAVSSLVPNLSQLAGLAVTLLQCLRRTNMLSAALPGSKAASTSQYLFKSSAPNLWTATVRLCFRFLCLISALGLTCTNALRRGCNLNMALGISACCGWRCL